MQNNSIIKHPLFGNLNVLKDSNGKLWFIGVEVARCLGYQSPRTIIDRLPDQYKKSINTTEFVHKVWTNSPGRGNPNKTIISEQGLIEFTTGYTEKGRNLVDQILHDNGYKTIYESQDDIIIVH